MGERPRPSAGREGRSKGHTGLTRAKAHRCRVGKSRRRAMLGLNQLTKQDTSAAKVHRARGHPAEDRPLQGCNDQAEALNPTGTRPSNKAWAAPAPRRASRSRLPDSRDCGQARGVAWPPAGSKTSERSRNEGNAARGSAACRASGIPAKYTHQRQEF